MMDEVLRAIPQDDIENFRERNCIHFEVFNSRKEDLDVNKIAAYFGSTKKSASLDKEGFSYLRADGDEISNI